MKGNLFYPPGVTNSEARLRYYAGRFSTVEVDSTYYALPSRRNATLWAARTEPGFLFHIKAYGALTGHAVAVKSLPRDLAAALPRSVPVQGGKLRIQDQGLVREVARRFVDALSPLHEADRLGFVLVQFSSSFRYDRGNLDRIIALSKLLVGLSLAVEFRHGSWYRPDAIGPTARMLRDVGAVWVTADEPQFSSEATVPFQRIETVAGAYFRYHGRNKENWFRRGIETTDRFDYLYDEQELADTAPVILEAGSSGKDVFVMFNNHHGAQAVINAEQMKDLLRNRSEEVL
ncbi:MAG: DUF72 domain-containing protein [Deltaproteobacteria bacterium]|nr:DUF72 domain-containing protein [Deltaproteobacteria bacterium]